MLNLPTITIGRCNPVIELPTPPLALYGSIQCALCQGGDYSAQIVATGGQAPYSFQLVDGILPPGLMLNEDTGKITGTATDFGSYTFTVRIIDALFSTVDAVFNIGVLVMVSTTLPEFVIGVPYSFQLEALGGSGTYLWVIQSGELPEGITMTDSGLISGTPTGPGIGGSLDIEVFDTGCFTSSEGGISEGVIGYDGEPLIGYQDEPVEDYP